MPQVFALVLAGAGLYAGFKWVQRALKGAEAEALRREAELRAAAARAGVAPKDLGTLEYDDKTGVYRPRGKA
jgi:hypothetical protein